jgi:hypothetical protein
MSDEEELNLHEIDEKGISEATRTACYIRDGWKCRKCGREEGLTLHHVIYRSLGGNHRPDNLVTVCWPCHKRIHDKEIIPKWVSGVWIFVDKKGWRYQRHRDSRGR